MYKPSIYMPDLLPLEPPEVREYWERDEDELYQIWKDERMEEQW